MMPVLTDDEAVALAVQRGAAWPSPLPTLTEDSSSLLSAALRGRRSLLVRDLVTVNSEDVAVPSEALRLCGDGVLNRALCLGIYVGRDDLSARPVAASWFWYGSHDCDDWMTESTSVDGVHAFVIMTRAQVSQTAAALISAAHESGVPSEGDQSIENQLVVLYSGTQQKRALLACRGRIRVASVGLYERGQVVLEDLVEEDDANSALERLGFHNRDR